MNKTPLLAPVLGLLVLFLMAGCEGRLSVSITDAPIDEAERVVIAVAAVSVKPSDDSEQRFVFDPPRSVEMLTLQGRSSQQLISEQLDEGDYDYIELEIAADEGELDSFIEFRDGSQQSLRIDDSASSSIRLTQSFSIDEDDIGFTIDFDLHRSIITPSDEDIEDGNADYRLIPVARIIENSQAASISGTVLSERGTALACNNDAATNSGKAVYLYSGSDITPGDFGSANSPLTAALVTLDDATGEYRYEFGFLAAGSYTLAFTCDSLLDRDNNDDADDVEFSAVENIELDAEENATLDF